MGSDLQDSRVGSCLPWRSPESSFELTFIWRKKGKPQTLKSAKNFKQTSHPCAFLVES
jgi:hypothetical protein